MSGRIRTIKPELLEDAKTAGLSDSAFRLFIGCILVADDYGNFRADPKWLDGQIWWTAVPEKNIDACLLELETPPNPESKPLAVFYAVHGQRYGHLTGWSKHQKVQHPGIPRVPGPPANDAGKSHETLTKPSLLISDHRSPITDPDHRDAKEARVTAVPDRPKAPKADQGARLTDDWQPSEGSRVIAKDLNLTEAELESALVEFRNYWTALPGRKAKKLDWDRTFQNRLAEVAGRRRRGPASGTQPVAARHQPIIQRGAEQPWLPKAKETA